MQPPVPYFREAGAGPGVVCLHSNASTSSQWRALMESLAPRFHVLAVDSFGAGKSPAWPADRAISLLDEFALLEPVIARAGDPYALVGHSYGAAVALIAAVSQPHRSALEKGARKLESPGKQRHFIYEAVRRNEGSAPFKEAKNGLIDDLRMCDWTHMTHFLELDV